MTRIASPAPKSAMVSMPSYDPNAFSDGISSSEWRMLSQDDHIPLMNKTLQGLYPPGSTFKPIASGPPAR